MACLGPGSWIKAGCRRLCLTCALPCAAHPQEELLSLGTCHEMALPQVGSCRGLGGGERGAGT